MLDCVARVRLRRRAENGLQVFYDDNESEMWKPPENPKNAKSREIIRDAIRREELFSHLQSEQLKMIIAAMARVEYKTGATIVAKGAHTNHFYILENGNCEVETSDGDVLLLANGSSFGGSSLLQPASSTRAVVARTKCILWRLDRSVYLGIVVRTTAQRKAKFEKLLSSVKLLQSTTPTERSLVADCLHAHFARAKSVIVRQGEKGDYFYIIVKGTAEVVDQQGKTLAQYQAGSYFGEAALLNDEPRGATVQAVTDCELARIDKKTFKRLVGALKDLNFREYEHDESGAQGKTAKETSNAVTRPKLKQSAQVQVFKSKEIREQDRKLEAFETVGQLGRGAFGVVRYVMLCIDSMRYLMIYTLYLFADSYDTA